MRAFLWILPVVVVAFLNAQKAQLEVLVSKGSVSVPETSILEPVSVSVEMINQSWFTDRMGVAVIHFNDLITKPEALPLNVKGVNIIEVAVHETPNSEFGQSTAIVRFTLQDTGVVIFPQLDFFSATTHYRTIPKQLMVSVPVRSDAMSLSLSPTKRTVYVGEPLRVNLSWHCDLEANRLQALHYNPAFFNDAAVEIIIPRSTAAERQQVGLPIGGRRVIAKRVLDDSNRKKLGTVILPLYLRFSEPGVYTLPTTRLECAYLKEGSQNFGQYAAHFNNSLFSPEESDVSYERFYVETRPIDVEVLPLPEEGRVSSFSGLFAPIHMEVSLMPTSIKVGELMQAELKVVSDAPHGMIELPQLSMQRGLRGRFFVDDNLARIWRDDGTTFRCRLRALTTSIEAFPALQVQVFDPEIGDYTMVSTEPVGLTVKPNAGQDYIDLKSYENAKVTLNNQSEGIWHNRKANRMNDLINTIVVCLASWFWLWLLLVFAGFLLMLPWVRERRRRALNVRYRARAEAYAAFRKIPESDSAKWPAFIHFLAVSFDAKGRAWTVGDSEVALQGLGLSLEDVESIITLHRALDAQDYSEHHSVVQLSSLNGVGKRIFGLLGKAALLLLLGVSGLPQSAQAADWTAAEALFQQALTAQAGSDASAALYSESALKFQAAAEAGERPGVAWYNAGNAWFQTGALGRSIAAYRQARIYRPVDFMLEANLREARALVLTDVPADSPWWLLWPTVWLKAVLLVLIAILCVFALITVRYRGRAGGIACSVVLFLCCLTAWFWFVAAEVSGQYGVVISDSVVARKGPDYAYAPAFHEPLYDGVEFRVQATREGWVCASLADGRVCWIPFSQTQLIR
jgi:hypothetical protein